MPPRRLDVSGQRRRRTYANPAATPAKPAWPYMRHRKRCRGPHVLKSAPTSGASCHAILRQLVVAVLGLDVEAPPVVTLLRRQTLRLLDASHETCARLAQCELWVDVDAARE